MNAPLWTLRWLGPLLIAAAPATAAPPTEPVDPPTIELLEYLAEFELTGDGHLLDPLDMQRNKQDEDPLPRTAPRSTSR